MKARLLLTTYRVVGSNLTKWIYHSFVYGTCHHLGANNDVNAPFGKTAKTQYGFNSKV